MEIKIILDNEEMDISDFDIRIPLESLNVGDTFKLHAFNTYNKEHTSYVGTKLEFHENLIKIDKIKYNIYGSWNNTTVLERTYYLTTIDKKIDFSKPDQILVHTCGYEVITTGLINKNTNTFSGRITENSRYYDSGHKLDTLIISDEWKIKIN